MKEWAGGMARTVLICEDNELNLKLLNDVLQAEGYGTVCCRRGEEALRAIRRDPPDLVLMDIRLPGMSGLDATRELSQSTRELAGSKRCHAIIGVMGNERS